MAVALTADTEMSQMLSEFSKRLKCRRENVHINNGIEQKLKIAKTKKPSRCDEFCDKHALGRRGWRIRKGSLEEVAFGSILKGK